MNPDDSSRLLVNPVGGGGDRLLVLVHGYGADENDLAPLAPIIDQDGRFATVCPRGPIDLPFGGAAWYDRSDDGVIDQLSFCRSIVLLDRMIDELVGANRFDPAGTVIVGFSQGAAMTLALALRETTRVRPAAVAALSGSIQQPDWFSYDWDASDLPPVFQQHGIHDPVVEIGRGHRTRRVLEEHGIDLDYHEYPMQHEITQDSIADLRTWLDGV
jgi:phospholipase/carboxylesterase